MQLFAWVRFASPVNIQMFACRKNTITVTYCAFPSFVAIKQFMEIPYSESIQASSGSYFDSSGLMVTNF